MMLFRGQASLAKITSPRYRVIPPDQNIDKAEGQTKLSINIALNLLVILAELYSNTSQVLDATRCVFLQKTL
jgi:hypothetical protein